MRHRLKLGMIGCVLLALSACQTTPANNHLDAEARPLIKEVDSVLIAKQTEVGADIKASQLSKYIQGHIAPALFDIGLNTFRTIKAKKHVTPIRETLSDYDFTADIKEEFNLALAKSGVEGADGLQVLRHEPLGFRAAYISQSSADAVMFVDVSYAFTPKFDNLNISSSVMLYPINPALSPYKETPDTDRYIEYSDNIYRNNFMASIPVGLDEDSKTSERAAAWAALSEAELLEKLQDGAIKLAAAIATDMNIDELPEVEMEAWDDGSKDLSTKPIDIDTDYPDYSEDNQIDSSEDSPEENSVTN